MALRPTIQLCLTANCSTLSFTETTGVYNATTNPYGYGAPNITIGEAVNGTLIITAPDLTTYTFVWLILPSNNPDLSTIISLATLGGRTSVEDGFWNFQYTITDVYATPYVAQKGYYFYCQSECCVAKLLTKIDLDKMTECGKNTKILDDYTKAKVLLQSIKNAASCLNNTNYLKAKALLEKICKNSNCKTCN